MENPSLFFFFNLEQSWGGNKPPKKAPADTRLTHGGSSPLCLLQQVSFAADLLRDTKVKSPSHHRDYHEKNNAPLLSLFFFSFLIFGVVLFPLKCVENADVTVSNRE